MPPVSSRVRVALFLTVPVCLVPSACGGDGDTTASSSPPSSATSATSTAPTTAIGEDGVVEIPVSARQQARLVVPGGPDWLGADDRYLYVKGDDGSVARIDPETNKVDASIQVGTSNGCQGLGVGFDSVWACRSGDLVRLDFARGKVTATIPIDKTKAQGRLVAAFGRIWVLTGDGSHLRDIDPATNAPGPPITLGARGDDLAADDTGIWVVSSADKALIHVDPTARTVSQRVATATPAYAVATGDGVWAGTIPTTVHYAATGTVTATVSVGPGLSGALLVDGIDLWVRNDDVFLTRVEARSGRVAERITAPVTGGDIFVAFGSLWASAYDDGVIYRIARP
jgi:hypothetical protein